MPMHPQKQKHILELNTGPRGCRGVNLPLGHYELITGFGANAAKLDKHPDVWRCWMAVGGGLFWILLYIHAC